MMENNKDNIGDIIMDVDNTVRAIAKESKDKNEKNEKTERNNELSSSSTSIKEPKYPRLPFDLSLDINSIQLSFVEEENEPKCALVRRISIVKPKQPDIIVQEIKEIENIKIKEEKVKNKENEIKYETKNEDNYFRKARILTRSLSGKLFFKEFKLDSPQNYSKDLNVVYGKELRIHQAIRQRVSVSKFSKLVKRYQSHIDQIDSNLQTPLHICSTLGLINYMKILIRRGCNVNIQDMNGFTPLHLSLIGLQLDTCGLLLETKKIDIMITNNENTSVLAYLVRVPVDETNVVLYRRILDLLIENGLDVNMQNKHGETALHSTCLRGNIHAAAFLLERAANCNIRNSLGETCLHYAVRVGNIKLVRLLMENGADPTIQGDDGNTPIDAAEEYQFTDMLDCLQVIIGDAIDATLEKIKQLSVVVNTPRVKVNEDVTKEGFLYIFQNNNQNESKIFVKVNNLSMNCFPSKVSAMSLMTIDLTQSRVRKEEGIITVGKNKSVWLFTISIKDGHSISFGATSPDQFDDWFQTIFKITETHFKLNDIYEKLKNLSEPRKKLHESFRRETLKNVYVGAGLLKSFIDDNLSPFEIANKIVSNIPLFSAVLSEVMNIDDDNVVKNIVNFFNYRNLFPQFAKAAIFHDISKTINGETLFREMSLSTRLLSIFLEGDEGREYLKSKVMSLITGITNVDHSLEVNPKYIGGAEQKSVDIKANLEKISEITQNFLDQVLSSANNYPSVFRDLMNFTRAKVDSIFPNMTHAVVGGFVFLRYLCPAIISPTKYGLTQKTLDPKSLRVVVLVSKILQSVSNGVEFDGSKEDYMQSFNLFIKRNRLHVNIFFDNLTNPATIGEIQNMSILSNPKMFGEVLTSTAENLANDIKSSLQKIENVHKKMEKDYGENIIELSDNIVKVVDQKDQIEIDDS